MIMLKAVEDLGQVGRVGRFKETGHVLMCDVFFVLNTPCHCPLLSTFFLESTFPSPFHLEGLYKLQDTTPLLPSHEHAGLSRSN